MFRIIISWVHIAIGTFKRRRNLVLENMVLRHQLAVLQRRQTGRPRLTRGDRLFWVFVSRIWNRWSDHLVIVKPETVIRWHRLAFKLYWRRKSRSRRIGRPRINTELRRLICKMARDNLWRAPRIHKELKRLGFDISPRTVARYIPKRPPCRTSQQSWKTFLRNHRNTIAAMDLFVVPTITFRLVYGFLVIHHDRRQVLHTNVTEHPTAGWVIQQLREAFPWNATAQYLICDRDSIFSAEVRAAIKSMGTKVKRTSYRCRSAVSDKDCWTMSSWSTGELDSADFGTTHCDRSQPRQESIGR